MSGGLPEGLVRGLPREHDATSRAFEVWRAEERTPLDADADTLLALPRREPLGELRILRTELAREPAVVERFLALAAEASAIEAACVLRVRRAGVDEGAPYVLVAPAESASLGSLQRTDVPGRTLPARVAASIVRDACDAASAVRAAAPELAAWLPAALDRDVLLVDRDGTVRLDPARLIARAAAARDGRDTDERAIVHALGALLYQLATGTALDRSMKRPPAPGELVRGFPAALDDVIVAALRPARDERTPTVAALAEALDEWLADGASSEPPRAAVATWIVEVVERAPSIPSPLPGKAQPSLRDRVGLGRLLDGKYRLDRVLGSGGMGVVFAGMHLAMQREVAVKVLLPRVSGRRDVVARFLREARVAGALRHPGVAMVHDVGEDQGAYYLVMELLEGPTLRERMREPIGAREACGLVAAICVAVAHAHAHGVVHRDLKPENVLLARDSRGAIAPKLLDFGISKPDGAERLTLTGAILGTPQYLAPEQVRAEAVGPRTDVYQLGAMLYELLSGEPPSQGRTYEALLVAIVEGRRAPLASRVPGLPPGLADVVERALATRPEARWADAAALGRALAEHAGPLDPRLALELGIDARAPAPPRRASWQVPATAGLALGMVIGALALGAWRPAVAAEPALADPEVAAEPALVAAPPPVPEAPVPVAASVVPSVPVPEPSPLRVRMAGDEHLLTDEPRELEVVSDDGRATCSIALSRGEDGALAVDADVSLRRVRSPEPSAVEPTVRDEPRAGRARIEDF